MLVVLLCSFLVSQAWAEIDLTVNTKRGQITGQRSEDLTHTTFFGIPYAKVNENHPFGHTQTWPYFETPFIANDSSIACPQLAPNGESVNSQLQCLRLNIYVPKIATSATAVPVLVWIHGGVFAFGSGSEFDGKYLVEHDIVVVTINYRLGPYGFLCLEDPDVLGNQGLKDQVKALRWVKENIAAFGGDPSQVTIAGESAGAGSVDLHLYSDIEPLFKRVIIESGSPFVEGMFVRGDENGAIKIAKALGHEAPDTRTALEFLAKSEPMSVVKAFVNTSLELRPCEEKHFNNADAYIKSDPFHLHSWKMKEIDILVGYNSKEEFRQYADKTEEYFENFGPIFYNTLKKNFYMTERELQGLSKAIHKFYLGDKPISKDVMLEIVDFTSDFMMNHAAEASVNKYISQGAPKVYKYLFSYVGRRFANYTGAGASHGDEMDYLFPLTELKNYEQKLIKDRMTTMWANFVKHGDPTPETTDLLPDKWDPVTNNADRPYMNIDVDMEMRNNSYQDRMAFWNMFWDAYWTKSVLIRHGGPYHRHGGPHMRHHPHSDGIPHHGHRRM